MCSTWCTVIMWICHTLWHLWTVQLIFLHCCLLVSGGAAGGLESKATCALENVPVLVKLAHAGAMVRGNVLGSACLCRRIPWHALHGEAIWYKIFPSAVLYTFTSFKWGQNPSTSEPQFKDKKAWVTSSVEGYVNGGIFVGTKYVLRKGHLLQDMFLCLWIELHLMKVELEGKLFGWGNIRVAVEKELFLWGFSQDCWWSFRKYH